MRLWPKREDDSVPESHGRHDTLVRELLQRFSHDAAEALVRRGWRPAAPEEWMAFAIARGSYGDLVRFGDRAVTCLRRSAFAHRWCEDALRALMAIGTPGAIDCLSEVVLQRWQQGQWDQACWEALREGPVIGTLMAEFYRTFDLRLARLLMDAGWQPSTVYDAVALAVASRDFARAAAYGEDAVPVLSQALSVAEDAYAVLEALADTHSQAGAAIVLQALRDQWARGVSRWTDSQLVARCGGAAVGPLLDLLESDPTHAVLAAEMLGAVLGSPQAITTEDLQRVASMADPVHLYQLPDDARTYQGTIDCSALRAVAQAELQRRGIKA